MKMPGPAIIINDISTVKKFHMYKIMSQTVGPCSKLNQG